MAVSSLNATNNTARGQVLIAIIGYFAVMVLVVMLVSFVVSWHRFVSTPVLPQGQTANYYLRPGATVTDMAYDMYRHGWIAHPRYIIWLAKHQRLSKRLQAGEYQITSAMTPKDVLHLFASGNVVLHYLTLLEGWTFQQMLASLEQNSVLQSTLGDESADKLMHELGSQFGNPEGLFFPDTYQYKKGMRDIDVLRVAYAAMQAKLKQAWAERDADVPYKSPYEALIVASLVERETKLDSERARVAGVIVRRLANNMRLQIDASVIYGLGKNYVGSLTRQDLRQNTPYNTYRHVGLPPTPIAMPSWASIVAALHPAKGTELYYVSNGDGSHTFSSTLEEHQAAVKRYRQLRKRQQNQAKGIYYKMCPLPFQQLAVYI